MSLFSQWVESTIPSIMCLVSHKKMGPCYQWDYSIAGNGVLYQRKWSILPPNVNGEFAEFTTADRKWVHFTTEMGPFYNLEWVHFTTKFSQLYHRERFHLPPKRVCCKTEDGSISPSKWVCFTIEIGPFYHRNRSILPPKCSVPKYSWDLKKSH